MKKIFLALGSNVGNKNKNIKEAIKLLSRNIQKIKVAPIYKSKAMYYEDQDVFLNTVISGNTSLSPKALLKFIKTIEVQVGRTKRFKWGPREIDIDIIFYGNTICNEKDLQIPHPLLQERDFVLQPLYYLDSKFIHPVMKKTVKELLNNLPSSQRSILNKRF